MVTSSAAPVPEKLRFRKRWSKSTVCVADPVLIRVTLLTLAASVPRRTLAPQVDVVGALVMLGRGARSPLPSRLKR
jgi:hypothetical protein